MYTSRQDDAYVEIKRSLELLNPEADWIKQDIELLRRVTLSERPKGAAGRKVPDSFLVTCLVRGPYETRFCCGVLLCERA
jgi:hypothetical protein